MGFDLFGDIFGKARRRKIEAAARRVLGGGDKPVVVDFGVLGTKLATGAVVAVVTGGVTHTLPADLAGLLTVAGAGLVAAGPSALQSSGMMTAISPNTVSAIDGLARVISGTLTAPATAKKAAFQSAVAQEVETYLHLQKKATEPTGSYLASELGGAPVEDIPAPEIGPEDAAITQTGGNQ